MKARGAGSYPTAHPARKAASLELQLILFWGLLFFSSRILKTLEFLAISSHGDSGAQGPEAALQLGQEETYGAMQAETDLQRQKQDHRGETLGLTGKGAGREGGGPGGVREAGGFTEEWMNTSDETCDTRTASYKWHRAFQGKTS